MGIRRLTILILLALSLWSCTGKREQELDEREKQIQLREKEFAGKEQEYKELLELRDSLKQADSISQLPEPILAKIWPDSIAGAWNGRMVCRESSCKNYVIGDQRTEKWVFSNDSIGLFINVMDNDKLKRQLRAEFSDNMIRLSLEPDSTAISKIQIKANLDDVRSKLIKGTQSLSGNNNCIAKFSVELTPVNKK